MTGSKVLRQNMHRTQQERIQAVAAGRRLSVFLFRTVLFGAETPGSQDKCGDKCPDMRRIICSAELNRI